MSANNLKFFDFEVYPNWWCCVVSDEEESYTSTMYHNNFTAEDEHNIKNKMRVYTSDDENVAMRLKEDLSKGVICGYNIKRFDLKMCKGVFAGFTPQKLRMAAELCMDKDAAHTSAEHSRIADFLRYGWRGCEAFQDLMDDNVKGLKDKECSLGMDIRETTVPFDKKDLSEQDKRDIIFYCKHDVYALHVYYVTVSKAYIDTKIQLCNIFGLNKLEGYSKTNAVLCGKVLGAERFHGSKIKDPTIVIRDEKLKAYFEKYIPSEIYNHLLTTQEAREFELYENKVSIGDGGLHSVYDLGGSKKDKLALCVLSTEEYTMYNIDASSCYPSVMIYCDAISRAIRKPERLKELYLRRLKLKNTPKSEWTQDDHYFVASAKLVLNTTFGAMGNELLELYDDYMRSKVCRIGQMILIALGNNLYQNIDNLHVIQNNTDGVLVYTKRSNLDKLRQLIKEFSNITNFVFEIEEDSKLWQLNVNNYIAVHPNGEIKNKGNSFMLDVYDKGTNKVRPLSTFGIAKAQIAFYVNKENPIKYLLSNTSVEDFCLSCTKGPGYKYMVQYRNNERIELGKVARVIAIENEELGVIKKCKILKTDTKSKKAGEIKEDSIALCPPHPLIVDDALYNYKIENGWLIHNDGRKWKIDYAYYARELDKVLDVNWYTMINDNVEYTKEFNL